MKVIFSSHFQLRSIKLINHFSANQVKGCSLSLVLYPVSRIPNAAPSSPSIECMLTKPPQTQRTVTMQATALPQKREDGLRQGNEGKTNPSINSGMKEGYAKRAGEVIFCPMHKEYFCFQNQQLMLYHIYISAS